MISNYKNFKSDNYLITDEFKEKLAKFISSATYSPILAIPSFLFINLFFLNFNDFIAITLTSIFFATVVPIAAVLIWSKRNIGVDIDLSKKEDRFYPLIIGIISYLIGTIVLYVFHAPAIVTILMLCYFLNTLVVLFINLFWKISIHSMGVAGPTTALIFAFGPVGSLLGLFIPLVMWSRVYLNKHDMSQVIMGAALGFILTTIETYLSLPYYGIYTNIFPILWTILALMLPPITLAVAGFLNNNGVKDGYTRKIFHFVAFGSTAIFLKYAPLNTALVLIIIGALSVGIACLAGNAFSWFNGIRRTSDYPNETLYVVLPLLSTIVWLTIGAILFDRFIMIIGTICVAIGDAIAEPIGVKFGKHKYNVFSLTGNTSQRSLEGSLSVFIMCAMIIFLFTNNLTLSLGVGLLSSFIEAISPRGTDNLTLPVTASIALSIAFMF
ncbi:hypothetical protein [Methanobacterium sp. MBAC-LM]|uniref:hypothetical protein n=1 Tax=Methanobacterium sp. MBAC-LM TaxID=3412034 RepID=UPI003C7556E8